MHNCCNQNRNSSQFSSTPVYSNSSLVHTRGQFSSESSFQFNKSLQFKFNQSERSQFSSVQFSSVQSRITRTCDLYHGLTFVPVHASIIVVAYGTLSFETLGAICQKLWSFKNHRQQTNVTNITNKVLWVHVWSTTLY